MTAKKNVLVLNCGSSSLKFALIDSQSGATSLSGLAERLGSNEASIKIKFNLTSKQAKLERSLSESKDQGLAHAAAIQALVDVLTQENLHSQIAAIGHRVVHGGEAFTQSTLIDNAVLESIRAVSDLAPLHNPANLVGIDAAMNAFPDLPQVAVFDTAFHQSMPEKAYLYAIDLDLYKKWGLRKYGFHGTSHYYVSQEAARLLNIPSQDFSAITVHLGNGCSICAVENGQSVDTSLGMTPVAGLVMGTRSGDIDPGLLIYLMRQKGYSADDVDELLNKKSGLLGLSKLSNDCRTLEEALDGRDSELKQRAQLALEVFSYRVAKYIASYTCALSHLDALIFTGGIGENSSYIRQHVIEQLSLMGITLDKDANLAARFGQGGVIQGTDSRFKVLVVPTNEELVIAQDAARLAIG